MAVIAEKTIGSVLFQEGDGVPIHSAPKGTVYIEVSDGEGGTIGRPYLNTDGATNWIWVPVAQYGTMYISDNTTASTISTTWTEITNLSFSQDYSNVFTLDTAPNDYRIFLDSQYPSMAVEVTLYATIAKATGSSDYTYYDVGVSINGANPEDNIWGTATVTDTADSNNYDQVTFTWRANIPSNNSLSIAARRRGGAADDDIIIRSAYLIVNRIR